jgi:hypothetical protein
MPGEVMQLLSISMMCRWSRRITVATLLCALFACSHSPSEQALRETLDRMQQAAEERAVSSFIDGVAEDFAGNGSDYDRSGLERLMRLLALRHQVIGVTRTGLQIEMFGDRAVVHMQILVTGGSGGLLPEQGQLFSTESAWRFVGGEWQLGSASWKPAG